MDNLKVNILFVLLFSFSVMNAGGGWPQPKGKTYLKLSEWWTIGDQHFTDLGELDPNVTLGIFNTNLYVEHGITNRLTGIVYFPLFSRSYNNNLVSRTTGEVIAPGDAINSIGDADIILKYGLTGQNSKVAISSSLLFGLPLGNDQGGIQQNLQTGDGEFNQMLRIDAGMGLISKSNVGLYSNAYVGYNNRTKGFSDEFRFGLEVGLGLNNYKWLFVTRLDVLESLQNGSLPSDVTSTSIFANNTEFVSAGFEINYKVGSKWGVSAGYASALSGKIIVASPSYSVGVFVEL